MTVFALIGVGVIVAMQMLSARAKEAAALAPGQGQRGPVAVEVSEVSVRPMVDMRDFSGTVKASYTYVISAKVGGRLLNLNKRIGDAVRANEMVGRIDDVEFKNALDEAQTQMRVSRASLQESEAQLSHTRRELERARGLVEKGIASRSELDALQTQVETQTSRHELAKAQLEQRQVVLDRAKMNFEYTQIRASQPGFVAQRHVDGGTLLSAGGAILTVVGLDTVFVELAVSEKDYQNLQPGKAATVTTDAIPGKTFEGVVYRKAPFFQSASRTAAVEIALRNRDMALKPGMFARINILINSESAARAVPAAALVEREGRFSVFVVGDSMKVRSVPVQVGINDGAYAQILSPPDLDGQIVTLGQHLLRPGSVVAIAGDRKREQAGPPEEGRRKGQ